MMPFSIIWTYLVDLVYGGRLVWMGLVKLLYFSLGYLDYCPESVCIATRRVGSGSTYGECRVWGPHEL